MMFYSINEGTTQKLVKLDSINETVLNVIDPCGDGLRMQSVSTRIRPMRVVTGD